jgi:hypothetical protein
MVKNCQKQHNYHFWAIDIKLLGQNTIKPLNQKLLVIGSVKSTHAKYSKFGMTIFCSIIFFQI